MGRRIPKNTGDPRKVRAEEAREDYHRVFNHPGDSRDKNCPLCRALNKNWVDYVMYVDWSDRPIVNIEKIYRERFGLPEPVELPEGDKWI